MVSNISGGASKASLAANEQKKQSAARAKGEFIVTKGLTLSQIARKFNMSVEDLKKCTGLKSSSLCVGQVLKGLPADTVKTGKGLVSVAREHGMSMKDFCELNGISEDYKPKAGEIFFVYPKKTNTSSKTSSQTQQKTAKTKEQTKSTASKTESKTDTTSKPRTEVSKTENKHLENSLKTPADIAGALKKSSQMTAVVGKDKFNIPFNKINKNNVIDVIKKYDEISPKESLIDMISSEWGSSKKDRMSSITKLYDTLAESVGSKIATPGKREEFMKELQAQYDSWGFVSTKKLDKMINELIKAKISAVSAAQSGNSSGIEVAKDSERSVATMGKKPEIPRDKDGNIIAEVRKFLPENKNGPLKGKTITVNAGHGWSKSRVFKPGTNAKDSNGKTIHEWYKNRNFADQLIKKLTAQGATVIYTAGDAALVCDAKRQYDSDLLISLHCNAATNNTKKNGLEVYYPHDSKSGKDFAQTVEKHLDKLVSFGLQNGENDHCKTKPDNETQHNSIGILQIKKDTIPSILIEMGYQSNEKDLKNIDSANFRSSSMDRVTDAVIEYLKEKG